jgi:hypothetical protein
VKRAVVLVEAVIHCGERVDPREVLEDLRSLSGCVHSSGQYFVDLRAHKVTLKAVREALADHQQVTRRNLLPKPGARARVVLR